MSAHTVFALVTSLALSVHYADPIILPSFCLTPTNDANVACHSAMMVAISAAHGADSTRNSPNPDQDSKLIMAALDRDKNGTIDYEEFRDWILSYSLLSREERREFVSSSQTHARLDWFAGAVVSIAREEAGLARRPASRPRCDVGAVR